MSTSVTASDVQKNFGLWHDKALKEPVQITKYGRETVYLVSAETFHELWSSYRRAGSTLELADAEMALMDEAKIPPNTTMNIKTSPSRVRSRSRVGDLNRADPTSA